MKYSKSDIDTIISRLEQMHPNAHCELNHSSNFELLVAVILSAQCTDKRVNEVTKEVFKEYNTPQQYATMPIEKLEMLIKPCGFYHNKARNIQKCAQQLMDEYNGEVPSTIEQLMTLSGVGRKTANVVYSVAFNGQAIAVDTHLKRLANRIGFIKNNNPLKVEERLMEIIPKEKWSRVHHLLIFHGRYICTARSPKCENCTIKEYCDYYRRKN